MLFPNIGIQTQCIINANIDIRFINSWVNLKMLVLKCFLWERWMVFQITSEVSRAEKIKVKFCKYLTENIYKCCNIMRSKTSIHGLSELTCSYTDSECKWGISRNHIFQDWMGSATHNSLSEFICTSYQCLKRHFKTKI